MKNKFTNITIIILSCISLIISCKTILSLAIFSDEFNTSPDVILGGEFWLNMNWLQIPICVLVCILAAINLYKCTNNK